MYKTNFFHRPNWINPQTWSNISNHRHYTPVRKSYEKFPNVQEHITYNVYIKCIKGVAQRSFLFLANDMINGRGSNVYPARRLTSQPQMHRHAPTQECTKSTQLKLHMYYYMWIDFFRIKNERIWTKILEYTMYYRISWISWSILSILECEMHNRNSNRKFLWYCSRFLHFHLLHLKKIKNKTIKMD